MRAKGLIHIHSTFSDGELSLKGIKKNAKKLGMSFVFLADHLCQIESEEEFQEIKKQCRELSDNDFLLVPGFEFDEIKEHHIVVYNPKILPKEKDISLKEFFNIFPIQENNFLVLAHPGNTFKDFPKEFLKNIDGAEVWNARYDSKYAPNINVLNWAKKNSLIPIIGSDAHSVYALGKLWIQIEINKLTIEEVINAFKNQKFKVSNSLFCFNPHKPINLFQHLYFKFVNLFYAPVRNIILTILKIGFKPPDFFKKLFHKIY